MWPQRHLSLLVAMIGMAQCNTQVEQGSAEECPLFFTEIGGCCYLFSSEIDKMGTWEEARAECQTIGEDTDHIMDLAEVGTSSDCSGDVQFMEMISALGEHVWLGASDAAQEGNWVWQKTGEQLSLSNNLWFYSDPSGGTSENCLLAAVLPDYHNRANFNDYPCSESHHFVCQIFPKF
ncbi:unnamed protein product [Meganyctiphanes norvegica]|uniref:C-type lectin domain-containing protein n=1 Tax=Meganyctiphanes norvegica TaxID=48144 RepID=A0AAV2RUD9_MEGNR